MRIVIQPYLAYWQECYYDMETGGYLQINVELWNEMFPEMAYDEETETFKVKDPAVVLDMEAEEFKALLKKAGEYREDDFRD